MTARFFPHVEYQPLTKVHVNLEAFKQNHTELQRLHPSAQICHVLKSDAYGHGLQRVAKAFDEMHSPFLVVDSLKEALELEKLKVATPILILGYTRPQNFLGRKLPFHIALFDLELATVLNDHQPGTCIHIFVDTGMNREGVPVAELSAFVKELKKLKRLNITGITSHFADADNPESQEFSKFQINEFKKAIEIFESEEISPEWRHIAASAGTIKVQDPIFNMYRVGLAGYGVHPLSKTDEHYKEITLKPALRFTSVLAQVKTIPKGAKVGYNCTFTAEKEKTVGLVPAGYFEGVDRRLSNNGVMKVNGKYCKILGRVSMNMTVIDLSEVADVRVGDEVEIYSDNPDDRNSLAAAAELAGTIPYELLVHISSFGK